MLSEPLRRKLLWMIGGRAAVITVLLGSAILIQLRGSGSFPTDPFFALIGLTYGLTVVWALTLRFVDRAPWLIEVQLACDALIVSAIVHLTGGVASYLSSLYTLPIIAASTIQSWRGGLMVSVLSSAMYTGLVIAQYQAPEDSAQFVANASPVVTVTPASAEDSSSETAVILAANGTPETVAVTWACVAVVRSVAKLEPVWVT